MNFKIIRFETCSSTNDVARELARSGAPAGTVVAADEQTAGRGTKGRVWISPRGKGLYVSVVVRPRVAEISLLPLAAGLAARDAVETASGLSAALRWPNDLVWKGRKLGGILCESAFLGNHPEYAILGTGLNVDQTEEDFPAGLRPAAVSIRIAAGTAPVREELLSALLAETGRRIESLERGGGPDILRDFERLSALRPGDPVAVLAGEAVIRGEYLGLDAEGALRVQGPGGVRSFTVAEIVKVLQEMRMSQLLAVDIGNTTIALGLFDDRTLLHHWRVQSDRDKTGDEYGVLLRNLFAAAGLDPAVRSAAGVETDRRPGVPAVAMIISSVVPPLTPVFQTLGFDLFGTKALVVGPGLRTGMPILYEAPLEVGADRVVAAVAAFEKYGGPCIVLDFGTATTFDAVSAKGEYLGGAIAPGVQISAEALYLKTAKLPRIEVRKPARVIGKTTVGSMQSGLYFGYVGLVRNIVDEIRRELGADAPVIATGGFAGQIAPEIEAIAAVEPNLVLDGLRIIHERNKGAA